MSRGTKRESVLQGEQKVIKKKVKKSDIASCNRPCRPHIQWVGNDAAENTREIDMGRIVGNGSEFKADIKREARDELLSNTKGICPCCKGEFATGWSGTLDHILPFELRFFSTACGLDFIGQRDNAMYICSDCNTRKSAREQRVVKLLKGQAAAMQTGRANIWTMIAAQAGAIQIFNAGTKKRSVRMGLAALKSRKKALTAIDASTKEKKLKTKAVRKAEKANDPKALARAKRQEFGVAHRRANERRTQKRRKVVNF
jgi:hypothetical protein